MGKQCLHRLKWRPSKIQQQLNNNKNKIPRVFEFQVNLIDCRKTHGYSCIVIIKFVCIVCASWGWNIVLRIKYCAYFFNVVSFLVVDATEDDVRERVRTCVRNSWTKNFSTTGIAWHRYWRSDRCCSRICGAKTDETARRFS